MFKKVLALVSVLVLLFTAGCSQENNKDHQFESENSSSVTTAVNDNNSISVDEFCNMAKGVWANLEKYDYGYEVLTIIKEGEWRYKYGVYETDNTINMEIKKVEMSNDTYKLTLYSPGGYNEMYDIYEEEEYEYVDVKLIANGIILDGTKVFTYFNDYSELNSYLNRGNNTQGLENNMQQVEKSQKTSITTYTHAALEGAVITSSDSSTGKVVYRKKCEKCGNVQSGSTITYLKASTLNSSFYCSKCKQQQQIRIQSTMDVRWE